MFAEYMYTYCSNENGMNNDTVYVRKLDYLICALSRTAKNFFGSCNFLQKFLRRKYETVY